MARHFAYPSIRPDGSTLATVSGENEARLWNVATRKQRGEPLRHDGLAVVSVVFSPDGSTLATASGNAVEHKGVVRLWDAVTGKPRCTALQHYEWVTAVSFSPDGSTLATACWDKTVRLWDVSPPAADAPERLWLSIEVRTWHTFDKETGMIRPLTHQEWRARKAKLDELRGPCDVREWKDVSPAERAQFRSAPQIRSGS